MLHFDEEPVRDNSFYRDFLPTTRAGHGLIHYVCSILIRCGFRLSKISGGFLSTTARQARVGLCLTSWERWSLAWPEWAGAGKLGCEGGTHGGGRKRKEAQEGLEN
jgi:uncharacterized protein (DUF2237 family)